MDGQKLVAAEQDGLLTISGLDGDGESKWGAVRLDERHVLLSLGEGSPSVLKDPTGFGSCQSAVFRDFLLSLSAAQFSGVLAVDSGFGQKRLFFERGQVVFAGSNIMDDRLGEVIFREARITLDELTDSATQVTKTRKFGQVLISSGIFSNAQLWQALKLQVRQILRSLFMVEQVYFETATGQGLAPTQVVFLESMQELVTECYSFGCAFRTFLGKLKAGSQVDLLVPIEKLQITHAPETFVGDLIGLISQQGDVQALLNASKLIDPYTVAALLNLVNQGLCRVVPEIDEGRRNTPALAPLRSKIDALSYVLQSVRRGFESANKELPLVDIRAFAAALNPDGFASIYLNEQGAPTKDCISGMFSQCLANPVRVTYFDRALESLIQFLLQVASDNLDYQVAAGIRQDFRAVSL